MTKKAHGYIQRLMLLWAMLVAVLVFTGCHNTRYIADGQHIVWNNSIKLHSDAGTITNKGALKDNLGKLVVQKPNTKILGLPFKLVLYNIRYKRYQHDTSNFQLKSKTVEKPVILDTAQISKSFQNMKSYLYNQGYFYARIKDTVTFKKKKAFVTYDINTGNNYLINKVNYDVDDSTILHILTTHTDASTLKKNAEFSYSLLEDERSRVTTLVRDQGYYRFSQDNITFVLDTVNKSYFKDVENPFEGAVNFIGKQKNVKPTLDITTVVRLADDSLAYLKYKVNKVTVFPDYVSTADQRDSSMIKKEIGGVGFRYHDYYVKDRVLLKHIYLFPGKTYAQTDYDKTIVKLNELGIFQYVRITFREDTAQRSALAATIMMDRSKKHDFSANYEASSGSTYSFGNSVSLNYWDRNVAKGANLLKISLSGGIETIYYDNLGTNFFQHFFLLTEYYGVNASIDFPKFIAPIAANNFSSSNLPHTVIGGGTNVLDRVNYFTLVNTSANFTYNWRESDTKSWSLSPAFMNIIRLPVETDSFKKVIDTNTYLRNSYSKTFIEGENIAFTYSDIDAKRGENYSYMKLSLEEAGGLLSLIDKFGTALNDLYKINYSQYVKFDFDGRHYFTLPHSQVVAVRFYGGIGLPYGQSSTLPYIKQYFAGGPYSMRGWRIRTLGPGSYYDSTKQVDYIDLTGDIKLEMNAEYRINIAQLFSGAIKMNGAAFADAGNIWLAKPDKSYPGGEFQFSTLGQDIAADVGAGLRFDVASFLTFRLDLAMPVKKPYVSTNSGWVFNQIDFKDPTWRTNNLIFNFAIGYPF